MLAVEGMLWLGSEEGRKEEEEEVDVGSEKVGEIGSSASSSLFCSLPPPQASYLDTYASKGALLLMDGGRWLLGSWF